MGDAVGRQGTMATPTRLDTRLLISREHEFIAFERLSVPHPFIQVEDPTRLLGDALGGEQNHIGPPGDGRWSYDP
jgi:hypothetical protein